ncbi:DUF6088 family protein [Sessilibacter corallicola]|uniref:DUF6088 family protein n=1 Tax=Sessilibacter corallicola TaxID=2904075 RepID=UPI00333FEF8B
MSRQTVRDKIYSRLLELEPATPLPYHLFKGLGSESSTQRAIRRLCEEGHLIRVMTGYYVRPKKHKSLPNITVTCSPETLAKAWAKERGYILTTTGFEEAYRLKFQTQAPVQTVYWTNGPSKTFKIGNAIAFTKHVADDLLLWHDLPVGCLYRAMLNMEAENSNSIKFNRALSLLFKSARARKKAISDLYQVKSLNNWTALLDSSLI